MLVADHSSAVKRSSESRAMPETEKPPARPVDIYLFTDFYQSGEVLKSTGSSLKPVLK